MAQIRGILFDKDGTLFDFHATWAVWATEFLGELACGNRARAQTLGKAIGFDRDAQQFSRDSPMIAGTPDEVVGYLLPYLPGTAPAALVTRMNVASASAPMQQAVPLMPLLQALAAQGLKLGVATNDAEAPARAHLSAAGIEALFDFVVGCDSGHGAKPHPGQLLAFTDAMGLAPASVLMVGDSRHDLAAGRAAGMGTAAVLTGMASIGDLADLADVVLPDIGHLPGYLATRAA